MPLTIPSRDPSRILLVEFNPCQILVAEISRPHRGELTIESSAEFDRDDVDGFCAWVETREYRPKSRPIVFCSLTPLRSIVQRESVQPARLDEAGYLDELVQEQQKGRFLTGTPFKVFPEGAWTYRTVNAVDGMALPVTGVARPALICAVASDEIVEAQQRLMALRLVRERIEPGLLSLFGAVYANIERRPSVRAVVVVVIAENVTAVYILGKEGVHTPNPVLHGLSSIVQSARRVFPGKEDSEVLIELETHSQLALPHAATLVRRIGRDLKPVIDSFEMTTGQSVDELLCAYLPAKLNWLAAPLAVSTGRRPFAVDCNEWLLNAKVQVSPQVRHFGPHWLGALNVAVNLPETFGRKSERGKSAHQRPWHVDCHVPMESDDNEFTGRRLLAVTAAAVIALVALAVTGWQLYAINSLRSDTAYWKQQLTGNQKLFDDLNTANVALKKQSTVLNRAHELMAEPFQLSELLLNLGRTIPPRMRVDRIESNDARVAISGALMEPAEEASRTLSRYMEELRRDTGIGPLFSHIAITSLQRRAKSDEVTFELTLRLNRSTP